MSSAAKLAANQANAKHSTGPRTETGRAASAKNATKSGLFAVKDFIRPGEEAMYDELENALLHDLAPEGLLEFHYADEILRAMWRLRRCGEVEATLVHTCAQTCGGEAHAIPDPMQNEATAGLQSSVDRARAQCHRLLNRCTAELRKLQTERHIRNETNEAGTDFSTLGLCETRIVRKALDEKSLSELIENKLDDIFVRNETNRQLAAVTAVPLEALSFKPFETPAAKQSHGHAEAPAPGLHRPSRNSRCTCGSGQKYKRCCGRDAALPSCLTNAA